MKISVYAICKNEEKFAARWAASMQEADQVVVLDTGSTDGTVEQLRQAGAVSASLGKRILRTETAALGGGGVVLYQFDELG